RGHVDNLIAREDRRAERLDRYLQTIRRNVERASHLVREMSEVAEIDRPGFVLTSQLVDLVAYFEQKVEEWQSVAESKSITLSASIVVSSDHDGWLQVDIHRVDQMLTNVLENALRVTPVGGEVSLNVEIRRDSLRMEISDSGPGFSERDLVHAFDPFYRGDQAPSEGHGTVGPWPLRREETWQATRRRRTDRQSPRGGRRLRRDRPVRLAHRRRREVGPRPPQPFQRPHMKSPEPHSANRKL